MCDYEAVFKEADKDGNNELTYSELVNMLIINGYRYKDNLKNADLRKLFDTADKSGDAKISFDEFKFVMDQVPKKVHKSAYIRQLCKEFDKDGNGEVDAKELRQVLSEPGENIPQEELDQLIASCDADGSGTLNYEELLEMVFD